MPRANPPSPAPRRRGEADGPRAGRPWIENPALRWGTVATVLIVAGTAVAWYMQHDDGPDPHALLLEALHRLDRPQDAAAWREAGEVADYLQRIGYRDPEFPGGAEYVAGLVAFRAATGRDEAARDGQYRRAAHLLREAESRALDAARRPELVFALGVSLYHVGPPGEARPLLEEAVRTYPPGRAEAAVRLVELYLDEQTAADLDKALTLSTALLESARQSGQDVDRARLRHAQVLLALGRSMEATALLDQVVPDAAEGLGARVLRGRVAMARGDFVTARQLLAPVAEGAGLDPVFPRQALYLLGRCAEELGEPDLAILDYERTAKKYPDSHEGLAASVRAAYLLRAAGRNEEALAAYERALRMVRQPEAFRNRWLAADEFRRLVLEAWNGWIARHEFAEAVALSRLMSPLFPEAEALEMAARAHRHGAEQLDAEAESLPYSQRAAREPERRRRWRETGTAYARMAEALRASARHGEAVWQSAECYRRGHALTEALAQTEAFIALRPPRGLPLAMVRRGELLMDLDRGDEALDAFFRVIAEHPSDPASFDARLLVARCHLERGRADEAERALRAVLKAGDLTPAAREWRTALFELGRLLCARAGIEQDRAELPADGSEGGDVTRFEPAAARWDEAVARLDEFLRRYPDAAEAADARFLLARALQRGAEYPRRRLKAAETENARQELARTVSQRLTQAAEQFQRVQAQLEPLESDDRLDPIRRRLLAESAFEIAHTYYALQSFEEAVRRYSAACHRYPRDPRVLLSYIQMSKCYERLGRTAEARSMIEQAKVLLRELPPETFAARTTNLARDEWMQWLDWAATALGNGPI